MGFIDKIVHKLDDQYNGIEYRNDKITEIKKNIEALLNTNPDDCMSITNSGFNNENNHSIESSELCNAIISKIENLIYEYEKRVIVTIIGLCVYNPLFHVLNVPMASMQEACEYMKIICYGTIFVFGFNAICSIMKGFGDSKSPLYFITIATIVNIVLDLILVGLLGMGTAGAAYATIFAQAISLMVSIIHLKSLSSSRPSSDA